MEKFIPKKIIPICTDCRIFNGACIEGAIPNTPNCDEKRIDVSGERKGSGVVYTLVGGEVRMVERNKPQK